MGMMAAMVREKSVMLIVMLTEMLGDSRGGWIEMWRSWGRRKLPE